MTGTGARETPQGLVPHLELPRVLHDGDEPLDLLGGELAGTLVQVHLSLLACHVGEAPPNTLDRGQREHDLDLAVQVGVEHTKDVLEV
jgi:hypothetical protein